MRYLLPLLSALLLAACGLVGGPPLSRSETVFGTWCSVRLVDGGNAKVLDGAFERLHALDGLLSSYIAGSEVSAVNKAAGGEAVVVSADTYDAIESALGFARLTEGVVDPTVGPLVDLWGIGTDRARVPSAAEITKALALVDWKSVELDPGRRSVRLAKPGMALDLGAFAKGWAADKLRGYLAGAGVRAAVIDLGGNIFVFGRKKDGKPWKVGIQDPRKERGVYMGVVSTLDASVTTAGVYERNFEVDGTRYHHILDLATGVPARSGLLAVTAIASTSVLADGIDTALLILGRERGLALAARVPGIEVAMVDEEGRVWLSPGASKSFDLTSKDWELSE